MITSVSLNPSIDKSVSIGAFKYASMNRVLETRLDAGGKAINLSYVSSLLGLDVCCVGLARDMGSDIIIKKLDSVGVKHDFIILTGSIRTNMKLLDRSTGLITEINESGETVEEEKLSLVRDKIIAISRQSDFLVLTGSLPKGCPNDFYAGIIKNAKCKCVLDAEGESLRLGILQKPYLIKPNRMELEMLMGRELESVKEIADAAKSLCREGVNITAVSLGSEGALITDGREVYFAPPLKIDVKSTVGAGDSMIAGFLSGLTDNTLLDEVLRRGVTCAGASISHQGTQLMDIDTYNHIYKEATVERML